MHELSSMRLAPLVIAAATAVTVVTPGAEAQNTVIRSSKLLLSCDVSPDMSLLVTGGADIRVFEAASGRLLHTLGVPRLTRVVRFSPTKADLFATGGDDGTIRLWQYPNTEPIHVIKDHSGGVRGLAFSPDGALMASAGVKLAQGLPVGPGFPQFAAFFHFARIA